MRRLLLAVLAISLLALPPGGIRAQTLAVHQPPAKPAEAAKPAPATIIPGTPLAALAGVGAAPPPAAKNPPSPFGTGALGFSAADLIGHDTAGPVLAFVSAVRKSTALTPVWDWLAGFSGDPDRRKLALQIAWALAVTVLPAWVLESGLRLALQRPQGGLRRRAAGIALREALPETGEIAILKDRDREPPARRRDTLLLWGHRLLLALLHLALGLLPVLVFVVAAGALLQTGIVASRAAHLSVIGVSNAYLFCRIVLEVLRFLIAPAAAPLRLVRMADGHAIWLARWVRILLITGGFSFAIVSIGEILDLPRGGAMAVTRVLVLALHVELAIMIWRSRKVVGGWIGGNSDAMSAMAGPRRRLGLIWHYLALFYVLALWVAWAGGVQNAFSVLLRVVLYFLAALILGRLAWRASEILLERLFPDPSGRELRHPNFYSRARAYNPLIRTIIRIVIGIAMVAIILLGWGVHLLPWLLKDRFRRSLISAFIDILITVAIALLIWEAADAQLSGRIDRLTAAGRTRQALRLRTLSPMLKASFGTALGLLAGLICLSKIGVNAAPLLAGAGVLGIAIGFGSQKLVQDIITGLFLLMEDTMQVGDVVTLAGMSGTVERLSIRTIRLRGGDGSVNIIPFSAVTTVTNQTRDFGYAQISIGVGYAENIDHVCAVLTDIARVMRAEPTWGPMMRDDLQINGLDQFGANALIVTAQIRTGPGQHWAVRREFSRRMLQRFAEEKIEIPFTK